MLPLDQDFPFDPDKLNDCLSVLGAARERKCESSGGPIWKIKLICPIWLN